LSVGGRCSIIEKMAHSGPGGPDAVEHVGSQGDGHDEVFGIAYAHYVAGFVLGKPVCAGVDSVTLISAGYVVPLPWGSRFTLRSTTFCPHHPRVHQQLPPAYLERPFVRSTLSSFLDPTHLGLCRRDSASRVSCERRCSGRAI